MPSNPSKPQGRGEPSSREQNHNELTRLKAQFLASLNHEIRTPLSGIMGMTDLLLETKLDEEQKEYVSATRDCAENLLALFNATLEYSDLSAGRLKPDEMEFDLPGAIRAAAALHTAKAAAKGLELVCDVDPHLPAVAVGDGFRLRQLLSHLIDNAVKFTLQGEVRVHATAGPAPRQRFALTIRVHDTGIGIPADKLPVIFDPFQQLDGGLSRSYSGLGLGLALAQKLSHLLGGEISVESEVEAGSTFSVKVPLRIPAALAQAPPSGTNGRPAKARILVVDDNEVAQRVVSHVLRRNQYEVTCASSGKEALHAVSKEQYDLILMDLQMPGMDGLETTTQVRRLPGCANVPIVALTANTTEEYRRLCAEHGMRSFLAKPVQSRELLAAVAEYV